MEKDKISVIVPVYNVENYLAKCLDSIVNQTYKNLEIIVIDDGSTDSSPSICDIYKEKDKRIKVIHKENGGISSARNIGLKHATGNFIAFVDSDDWIDLSMYEKLLSKQKEKDYDMVFCRYFKVYPKEGTRKVYENDLVRFCEKGDIHYIFYPKVVKNKGDIEFFYNNVPAYLVRILFKKDIISTNLNEEVKHKEDVVFLTKLLASGNSKKIAVLDEYLYYYLQTENSVSRSYGKYLNNNLQKFLPSIVENLKGSLFEDLIPAFEFSVYLDAALYNLFNQKKVDLSEYGYLAKKENYKSYKKVLCKNFKQKVKAFLIKYGFNKTVKFICGLKNKD